MLRFKTKAVVNIIDPATFTDLAAVQEIARIQLEPRFRSPDLQQPSGLRIQDPCRLPERSPLTVQNEVMVIAFSKAELLVGLVDTRTYRRRRCKVERRTFYTA